MTCFEHLSEILLLSPRLTTSALQIAVSEQKRRVITLLEQGWPTLSGMVRVVRSILQVTRAIPRRAFIIVKGYDRNEVFIKSI